MILLYLTLAAVGILILALVVYLVAIIYFLRKADQHLVELLGSLQETERNVELLPGQLPQVNDALTMLRDHLRGTRRNLEPIDDLVTRKQEV
jgi:uncharacterized protein YoxC